MSGPKPPEAVAEFTQGGGCFRVEPGPQLLSHHLSSHLIFGSTGVLQDPPRAPVPLKGTLWKGNANCCCGGRSWERKASSPTVLLTSCRQSLLFGSSEFTAACYAASADSSSALCWLLRLFP